ncbi:hypothetical protein K438DRAFT_1611300 [Mycena galopus ATCC 62051]|nr:hypothetical protein K438DRAFT_1611300 [Mycena galopus ATCC 62051]
MSGLSLASAELVAHTFDGVMYGIYLVTLGIAGRSMLTAKSGEWKRRSEINWITVGVSVVLFVNATLNIVISTITLVEGFVLYEGPGGADQFFANGSGWQTLTKSFTVPFQSLVGDGILIYRCWCLWNNSWLVIALPLLIWLSNIACAIRLLDLLATAPQALVISTAIQPWGQAFWSMTICINVMSTGLIVARIWMVEGETKKYRDSELGFVLTSRSALSIAMRNVIESGMIYTIVSIFTLVTYTMQSTLSYPVSRVVSWIAKFL